MTIESMYIDLHIKSHTLKKHVTYSTNRYGKKTIRTGWQNNTHRFLLCCDLQLFCSPSTLRVGSLFLSSSIVSCPCLVHLLCLKANGGWAACCCHCVWKCVLMPSYLLFTDPNCSRSQGSKLITGSCGLTNKLAFKVPHYSIQYDVAHCSLCFHSCTCSSFYSCWYVMLFFTLFTFPSGTYCVCDVLWSRGTFCLGFSLVHCCWSCKHFQFLPLRVSDWNPFDLSAKSELLISFHVS